MRLVLLAVPALVACDPRVPDDSPTSQLLGFTPSNVTLDPEMFDGVGDVVMDDPDGCTVSAIAPGQLNCRADRDAYRIHEATNADGSPVRLVTLRSLWVTADTIAEVGGDEPLVIVALDRIDIDGALLVQPGKAGGVQGSGSSVDGTGPGAGVASAGNPQNGTGASHCGRGGAAGDGTEAPSPYGSLFLVPLVGGSSGGGRFSGAGGGAIQLVAGQQIAVAGTISAPGQGDDTDAGGGSGGAILLEAQTVSLTGVLAANGGGGASEDKVDAEDGPHDVARAAGGVSNDDGAPGGAGGGADQVEGDAGGAPTAANLGGGSGGGGAGRIRINVLDEQYDASGRVSPDHPLCTVVGEVTPVLEPDDEDGA